MVLYKNTTALQGSTEAENNGVRILVHTDCGDLELCLNFVTFNIRITTILNSALVRIN